MVVQPVRAAAGQTGQPAASSYLEFGFSRSDIPAIVEVNGTPPRVVQLLTDALAAHPAAVCRAEIIHDLGLCKLQEAVAPIIAAMGDSDSSVRAEAAQAAAQAGDAAAVRSGLLKLMSDSDPTVRREAVIAGAALNDSSLVKTGIADRDESVFIAACDHASDAAQDGAIAARFAGLSSACKLAAVRTLGRHRDATYASPVAGELNSADLPLKIAAITALGSMNATARCDDIKLRLSDEFPSVRRSAVIALSALATQDEQVAIARRMLKDPDLSVRQAAAEIFIAHPSADDVQSLFAQLSENYGPLHDSAREAMVSAALSSIHSVVESAAGLLSDASPDRRIDGSYILGHSHSDYAFQKHLALLQDKNWAVVRQAAESLGLIARAEAGQPLAQLASQIENVDPSSIEEDRLGAIEDAFRSCGRLRFEPILPLAQRIMPQKTVYPSPLRASAIWAAGVIGNASDTQLASMCLSIANDNSPFESEDARYEAIKAIGNLHYLPALDEMRRQGKENPISALRWISHLVADRLAGGQPTPYVAPSIRIVAETSIRDLSQ
jgi:HEAT repeat protein